IPDLPIWQQPDNIALAKDLGKQLGFGVMALLILTMLVRPALKMAAQPAVLTHQGLKTSVDETLELPNPGEPRISAAAGSAATPNQGMGMTIAQHNALQLARTDPTA